VIDLKGKTALVTGAAKRLGRATALLLAENGVNVVLHYNQSRQAASKLAEELKSSGVEAWLVRADLADRKDVEGLVKKAAGLAGKLSLLVNNASVFQKNRISDFTGDDLDLHVQVNAFAPLLLSRSFAAKTAEGAIVNLLDSRVAGMDREHAAYHLSKKMLLEITGMLAVELAPGIRVNGVAPGLVLPPPGEDVSYLERNKNTVPLARYGDARDIAAAVLFLAKSEFVTGQVIYVDGGRHLAG
jgi:pteridine reductase